MTNPRSWRANDGDIIYRLVLHPGSVDFSSGGPSPYSQGGAAVSHEEFRNGRFHDDVERHFGGDVLRDILSLLSDVSEDPFFGAEGQTRKELIAWSLVEVDQTLTALAENGDEYGGQRFHLADAARAKTNGHSLSMERHTATITRPDQTRITIPQPLPFTALLAHDSRFFIAANGHGYVFDTDGAVVTSTEHLVDSHGMSHGVRVSDVIRSGADLAFAFWTFGNALDPAVRFLGERGTFRLSNDGQITARGTHSRAAAAKARSSGLGGQYDNIGQT